MKVQFGCGGNFLDGWINHDSDVDISKRLPYDDGAVDEILAEHVVEHISHIEALGFIEECLRILKPGGVVRLCMPVLEGIHTRAHAKDLVINHGHKAAYTRELIMVMLWVGGFSKDKIFISTKKPTDGHWRVIGEEKDSMETARIEAVK